MEIHSLVDTDNLRAGNKDEELFNKLRREHGHNDERKSQFMISFKQVVQTFNFIVD